MTLVIMAAGMGSRFGGLKQIEPVGKNGEFILDFSIYDAIRNGFNKVVFIIKEENYNIFRDTVGKRIENHIEVEYVFQKNDNLPKGKIISNDRTKPLGTGHAIYCCKDVVKENFIIINADDFYGNDAFKSASEYIKNNLSDSSFGMIGYKVINTLTENGTVKRGVCEFKDNFLTKIIESSIDCVDKKIIATPLSNSEPFTIADDCLVSMNMFIFTPKVFEYFEKYFNVFLNDNNTDLAKDEFQLPSVVYNCIKNNLATVKVVPTNARWLGITYKEDKESLISEIDKMISNNEYPEKLWN